MATNLFIATIILTLVVNVIISVKIKDKGDLTSRVFVFGLGLAALVIITKIYLQEVKYPEDMCYRFLFGIYFILHITGAGCPLWDED